MNMQHAKNIMKKLSKDENCRPNLLIIINRALRSTVIIEVPLTEADKIIIGARNFGNFSS